MKRRSRRFRRGDAEYVWCGLLTTQNALAAAGTEENAIITPADWTTATGLSEATLMRIRASLSAVTAAGAVASVTFHIVIYKSDLDAPVATGMGTVGILVDEDVLYSRTFMVLRGTTEIPMVLNEEIDVRAKRRIKSMHDIRVAVWCSGGGACTYSFSSRALVKI